MLFGVCGSVEHGGGGVVDLACGSISGLVKAGFSKGYVRALLFALCLSIVVLSVRKCNSGYFA